MVSYLELITDNPSVVVAIAMLVLVAISTYRWQRRNVQHIRWSDNDVLYYSMLGWTIAWAVINGGGNASFALNLLAWLEHEIGGPLPLGAHDPVLWFLVGTWPSVDQFLFQSNPALVLQRFGVLIRAIVVSIADGLGTIFGIYWFFFPLMSGKELNLKVFAFSALLGIFGCYIAQYAAHARAYDVVGMQMPEIPLPPMARSILSLFALPFRALGSLFGRSTGRPPTPRARRESSTLATYASTPPSPQSDDPVDVEEIFLD